MILSKYFIIYPLDTCWQIPYCKHYLPFHLPQESSMMEGKLTTILNFDEKMNGPHKFYTILW